LKTVRMKELPQCDFCPEIAKYDAPISKEGKWAYFCETHYKGFRGTRLEKIEKKRIQKPKVIEIVIVPLTLDSIAEVECPYCELPRTVETDANYTVECEACGNDYEVESLF